MRAAAAFVAAGDAERMVVIAADDAGPAARDRSRTPALPNGRCAAGAVALLLDAESEGAVRESPSICASITSTRRSATSRFSAG